MLLKEMPTLDDIDVAVRQVRDVSRGMQIPGTDDAGSQRGAGPTSGPAMGKEKVVTFGPAPKAGSLSPQRRRGGWFTTTGAVSEPMSGRQEASSKAAAELVSSSSGGWHPHGPKGGGREDRSGDEVRRFRRRWI
jgi:hypothetical protein